MAEEQTENSTPEENQKPEPKRKVQIISTGTGFIDENGAESDFGGVPTPTGGRSSGAILTVLDPKIHHQTKS